MRFCAPCTKFSSNFFFGQYFCFNGAVMVTGATLCVDIIHWPGQSGGQRQSWLHQVQTCRTRGIHPARQVNTSTSQHRSLLPTWVAWRVAVVGFLWTRAQSKTKHSREQEGLADSRLMLWAKMTMQMYLNHPPKSWLQIISLRAQQHRLCSSENRAGSTQPAVFAKKWCH